MKKIFFLAGALLCAFAGFSQNWNQIIKATSSQRAIKSSAGRSSIDYFGTAVAVDGNYAVVGAFNEDQDVAGNNTLNNAGSVLVFENIGGVWTQVKKLVAADRGSDDWFGFSVAISGTTVVVGAHQEGHDATGANPLNAAGSAYIFSKDQGGTDSWGQVKKLVAADRGAGDNFGWSVSISGSTVVVGAKAEDEDAAGANTLTDAGSAYVFSKDQGGANNWGEVKKLVAADRGSDDWFGFSVAISGSTVVVGAFNESEDATGNNMKPSAGSAYVFSQDQGGANNWGQVKKLVAADRGVDDQFGYSVAISGNTLVVAARSEDESDTGSNTLDDAGSAYVFSKDQGGINNWGQVKKLVAADRATYDQFGYFVAISGSTIVVGAKNEDEDVMGANTLKNAGSAYVFSQDQGGANNWGQVKKLLAADRGAGDEFGRSVAISGTTVIVGAPYEDEDATGANMFGDAGSAYVFSQDQGGADNWGQQQKIVLLDAVINQFFGLAVAVDGNYAVVGSLGESLDANGANPLYRAGGAYILYNNAGVWTEIKKLVAADRGLNDQFGYSVAISGSTVIVGAQFEDEDEAGTNMLSSSGSVYVFNKDQGGTDNWGQVKKLVAADRGVDDQFGSSVSISGNTVVVGAYREDEDVMVANTLSEAGAAYVFSKDQGGTDNWGQVKKLVAADRGAGDQFGFSVAISGSTVVVGAQLEDEDAAGANTLTSAGSAYVFSQDQGGTNNWGQVKKLVADDRGSGDQFGYSVAISGSTVVVGAQLEDEDAAGTNMLVSAGSAYIFSQDEGGANNWGQVKKLVAADRGTGDTFGNSVTISSGTVVVGAKLEDEDAAGTSTLSSSGSAYIFSQDEGGVNNWGQVNKLVAADRGINDQFGISVAISGNTVVVGAWREDEDAAGANTLSDAGSAYVFSRELAPVPLKWLQAGAVLNDEGKAEVHWQAEEISVASYTVEKSNTGRSFLPVGQLASQGDGTRSYRFTDPVIVNGVAYYRIRQTDLDGKQSYSPTFRLRGSERGSVSIWPNPVAGAVTVQVSRALQNTVAVLSDLSGKIYGRYTISGQRLTLDLSTIPAGVYLLHFADGQVQKLIRQ